MKDEQDVPMTPETFDRMVREHQKMVYSIALAYCRDPHTADDIAQETFIRAHRSINGLLDGHKLKTWLYTLTRHEGDPNNFDSRRLACHP